MDPSFHAASFFAGSAVTERHNMLVRLLAQLFCTNAGVAVRITPKIFDTVRMIPDLQVIRAEGDLFVDAVVSPRAFARNCTRSGCLGLCFQRRYRDMVEARGAQLLAFTVDSFGERLWKWSRL